MSFWSSRRVVVTGHGFLGCLWSKNCARGCREVMIPPQSRLRPARKVQARGFTSKRGRSFYNLAAVVALGANLPSRENFFTITPDGTECDRSSASWDENLFARARCFIRSSAGAVPRREFGGIRRNERAVRLAKKMSWFSCKHRQQYGMNGVLLRP